MKRTIFILALCLTGLGVTAQEFNRYEISINAGGGVSGFQTKPTEGKSAQKWTTSLGAGYHFFFNPKWGIGTGVNFAAYNGGVTITNYTTNQATTNLMETGNPFDFRVSIPNYRETHQAMMATIPLMLQHQSVGKTIFYGAIGVKAGLPLSAKNGSKGRITSTGYYDYLAVLYEDMPEYGFVTDQRFPKDKTDIDMKPAFMASVEVGVKRLLVNKMNLYLGLYFDYGLNDVFNRPAAAPENANIVVFQPDNQATFAYNTALNSYSSQMIPFAIGITARLTIAKKTWDKSYFRFREDGN